jgi:hypothetical protein
MEVPPQIRYPTDLAEDFGQAACKPLKSATPSISLDDAAIP